MKIYETKTAPNPRRVRMFLAEKGIEKSQVEYVQVDIQKGENLSAEMRAKNPLGKIPILELAFLRLSLLKKRAVRFIKIVESRKNIIKI